MLTKYNKKKDFTKVILNDLDKKNLCISQYLGQKFSTNTSISKLLENY